MAIVTTDGRLTNTLHFQLNINIGNSGSKCLNAIYDCNKLTKRRQSTHFKDVRAHCYCASLVRTLYMTCACHVMYFKRAHRVESQQNIELVNFAVT